MKTVVTFLVLLIPMVSAYSNPNREPKAQPQAHQPCLDLWESYQYCVQKNGTSRRSCTLVSPAYKICRQKHSQSHQVCKYVGPGYGDCRNEGRSHQFCFGAQAGYQECRAWGASRDPRSCLRAVHGYSLCISLGFEPRECLLKPVEKQRFSCPGFPKS